MKISPFLSLLLILFAMQSTFAQDQFLLYEGDVVRIAYYPCVKGVRVGNMETKEGTVRAFKDEFLHITLLESEEPRIIPWNCMQKWWLRKTHYSFFRGFVKGGSFGLLAGAAIGIAVGAGVENDIDSLGAFAGLVLGMPGGFLLGGIIGGIATSNKPFPKWQRIKNKQIIVEPKVSEGAVGIGLTLNF